MRTLMAAFFLALSLCRAAPSAAASADPDPADATVLREAGLALDDKALLGFLHARTSHRLLARRGAVSALPAMSVLPGPRHVGETGAHLSLFGRAHFR
jgi:hypothetical protein